MSKLQVQQNTGRSPQQILEAKSAEIGANIASQGSTRTIFDTAPPVAAGGMMRFFNQNRAFPNTNFNDQFQSGESLLLTHLVFAEVEQDTGEIQLIDSTSTGYASAYFLIKISNSTVLQNTRLDNVYSGPVTYGNTKMWLPLESGLFLPPQIEFEVNLFLPAGSDENYVACFIAGVGTLLNIKNF